MRELSVVLSWELHGSMKALAVDRGVSVGVLVAGLLRRAAARRVVGVRTK